ncbi:MAG: hypothetical protein ACI37O_06975 [Candidatus Avelusimicrobium sp.]|uniref:hypothetical protein n=1 Tax=Candidatus Avelusimicrobium sp. TaxID=3048833 RepID=UPI003F04AABC
MQIGNIIIEPWNRRNFLPRVIALALLALWLGWGLTIFMEGREINARFQALQEEQQLKEERARRAAAYRNMLEQQQRPQNRVQNAVDSVKN